MRRHFVDAPTDLRCSATITLRDDSTAQCGRHAKTGGLCTQHAKMAQRGGENDEKIVGWWWNERAAYCAAHKPSAPDDALCMPLMAGDCEGETCDDCGVHLNADHRTKVTASLHVTQGRLDRLITAMQASDPTWTLQDALAVALAHGMDEMLERYERMASRGSPHGAAVPTSPNGECP